MQDPDFLLAQAREKEQSEEIDRQKRELQKQRFDDLRTFQRLTRLAEDAEVRWFLETFVAPIVSAEQRLALDVRSDAATRSDHAHRHDIAAHLAGLLDAKLAEFSARSKIVVDE